MIEWQRLEVGIRARIHPTRKHGALPDRYFVLRYSVDGVKKQEALGWASRGWTLAKARDELAKLRAAARTGEGPVTLKEKRELARMAREAAQAAEQQKLAISGLWERYRAAHAQRASIAHDTCNYKHFAELHGLTTDLLRTAQLDALREKLFAQGKAPQTVKHVLGLLRRIIRWSVSRGLCRPPDPSRLHFEMPRVDNQRTECLTPEQAKRLFQVLDASPERNLAALLRLALATGLRRKALFGLQWDDLDFRQGVLVLRGEHAKKGRTAYLPMTPAVRAILENIERTDSPYVFPGKNGGKRGEARAFCRRVRELCGLPKEFRILHGLRHTYASWLASSGQVDLFSLQRLLTHESPQMTLRYAHLADSALRRAAGVIDACLRKARTAQPTAPPRGTTAAQANPASFS
ncbi:MAG: site-specific integrase [Desulfovibrio sp.]|uniref:tyrosine-type recombinase/integrase n=1 Tax=Desulfovibrio sp. TaxID=885 RepID=UPI00258E3247|nr:tyrosine-type recombinase/integrase [Desulfovibrio sp.]MCD7984362.1 site-specific integrase [Desulfovibrio sp.]